MDKIYVVDFGSQYNQLIVKRIRKLGVYSELIDPDFDIHKINNEIANGELKGIVLSGGPDVITKKDSLKCDEKIFELDIPILGICYGMQFMANFYGNLVVKSEIKEYGKADIKIVNKNSLFTDLSPEQTVWMSHGYHVELINDKFEVLAISKNKILASIKHIQKEQYGVQFHPEVLNTINGNVIINNFLNICNVQRDFNIESYAKYLEKNIKDRVENNQIILGLSGGVDSTVVAALLARAVPGQLTCIIVDHGLMRKNEIEEVLELLKGLDLKLIVVDAKTLFLNKLKNIEDPEQKRKIIGNLFVEVFDREKGKLENVKFLAQGTLYTDIIESGTKYAQTIKSHHNVGGLPKNMDFELIEPLKYLFKDDVRELGLFLGLDDNIVYRQPFPGPGLAIRIIGDVTEEKLNILRESDYILRKKVKEYNLHKDIWQYFTVLTNLKTVGVKGDERSYEYVLAIRAVNSIDGMTAKYYPIEHSILEDISTTITNEVSNVNRIVYDITSKPPSTIEWE